MGEPSAGTGINTEQVWRGRTPQGLCLRRSLYEIKKLGKNIIVVLHDE